MGAGIAGDAGLTVSTGPTLGDRLAQARRRRFVGRADELDIFRALVEGDDPCAVLFVHGPGGVGKTALLGRFAEMAQLAGMAAVRLDARTLEPSPPAFLAGFAQALGVAEGASPFDALRAGGRHVLLLDTYEAASPLDGWLRGWFLPQLPSDVVIVIAGRNPPGPEWVTDAGWRELLRTLALRNLDSDDTRADLRVSGVEDALHDGLLQVTHGHPLALALISDVVRQRSPSPSTRMLVDLSAAPNVVGQLVERFIEGVPAGPHREALQVCAHTRFTTEDLLAHALGGNASEIFSWLRSLSFVEEGAFGLFPHDLARDVLDADLRWRDPARYAELHRRIRGHVVRRAQQSAGPEQQRACTDILFLHRTNPRVRPFMDWSSFGHTFADVLHDDDRQPILAMVERHEGDRSAAIAARWADSQPEAFTVFRGASQEPIGFTAVLALHDAHEDDLAADPGARAMWECAARHDPPEAGEQVVAFRFLMDRDAYQAPSASFNLWGARGIQHIVTSQRLAWSFAGAFAEPEFVAPMLADIDYHRAYEADFEVGGRRYGVFAHDFRRVSQEAWLQLTAEREITEGVDPPGASASATNSVTGLSHAEFAEAVRQALRDLHASDRLAANSLLRARMLRHVPRDRSPSEALAGLIAEEAEALVTHPRDEKLYRALDRTYIHPAPTQERAAELLGLPFSTYRRHLAYGVERLTARLWHRERHDS